jgi:SAM-dependent methyltransferase/tetratricopeptide (TPR) repeat protein
MNRRERRATAARGKPVAGAAAAYDIGAQFAAARQALAAARPAQAEAICKEILARAPAHVGSLNLLGLIAQASGQHRLAIKMFAKAIAVDELDAACHYNIASSYQLVNERTPAAAHFTTALALGLSGQDAGDLAQLNPAIAAAVSRASKQKDSLDDNSTLFDEREVAALAADIFFRCALQSTLLCGVRFELLFTRLRLSLLGLAEAEIDSSARLSDDAVSFFCALAQQCFIHEYVFAPSAEEDRRVAQLRARLLDRISAGSGAPPILLAAVGAYYPLHAIAGAQSLLAAEWPQSVAGLLRQQIREPLAEAADRDTIPALTAIDDATSVDVKRQYEENPYPRWILAPPAALLHIGPPNAERTGDAGRQQEILVAGCGTGRHAVAVAQQWPLARMLAIDISRVSLTYARRKAREAALGNVEFAQADILKLAGIGRTFDRIEAMGVLHHLADPEAGWRVLLKLLRPHGIMRVGLYSEAARHSVVEARALIAARGYPATATGIRALRRDIIANGSEPHWQRLLSSSADFFCMSGCRDLFFHVMEHRFSIPQIAAFLHENGLKFLGFELDPESIAMFRKQHPAPAALTNLDYWHAFEQAHPDTFRRMYVFEVQS